MVRSTQLYEILELESGCSSSDIKKAYRRLAMLHHPDKNPEASSDKFQAIQGAYEILSDDDKRAAYDRFGLSGVSGNGAYSFGGGGDDDDDDDGMMDMNDFLAHMFGGSGGGGPGGPFGFSSHPGGMGTGDAKRRKRAPKGENQIIDYKVSMEDAFSGKERTLELEKNVVCHTCKGTGGKKGVRPRKCGSCKGQGIVMIERMIGPGFVTRQQAECPDCDGEGEYFKGQDKCKKCKGKKTVKAKKHVEVYIEKGARNGDRIVLRGEGEQYPEQQPGDVVLLVRVNEHDTFKLASDSSNNLYTEVTLTLSEALLGFDRLLLTHLDGRGIRVSQPGPGQPGYRVFSTGDVVQVRGEGFPKKKSAGGVRGDLLIRVTVEMPTKEEMEVLNSKNITVLDALLPAKRPDVTNHEIIDEVELTPVARSKWPSGKHGVRAGDDAESADDDNDDEDEDEPHGHSWHSNGSFDYDDDGGPRAQCAHQ